MALLQILKIIAAIGTVLTGAVSIFWPRSVTGFTGLEPRGGRGITEIRAILGAVFLALGVVPLVFGDPLIYQSLGIVYLVVGAVRTISMFIDKSIESSNLISIGVEIAFGIVLVL